MFRKLAVLVISAIMGAGVMANGVAPSYASHIDGGKYHRGPPYFGDEGRYYRKHRPWRHHKRRHHGPSIGFHFGVYPSYPAPVYRSYRPPVVYHTPRVRYRSNSAHVAWCYDRYRSYRAYDNTFQPYNGPRRQCRSPYG